MNDEKKLLLKVLSCLIDTVKNVTDLDNVYDNGVWGSVSWDEVYTARERLRKEIRELYEL